MKSMKRIAGIASAATLAGGAIAGCGSDAATTSSTRATQQQSPAAGQLPRMDLSALAKALGVSEDKLQSAMEANRPEAGSGDPGDMPANLAEALGLSTEKVQAALQDLVPQGVPPQGGQAPAAEATNS